MKKIFYIVLISFLAVSCSDEYYAEGYVKTHNAAEITNSSALLSGNIKIMFSGKNLSAQILGNGAGFKIWTDDDNLPNITVNNLANDADFACTTKNLLPNTKYYVRAYARIGSNTYSRYGTDEQNISVYYGNVIEFTTKDGALLPSVATQAANDITATSATLRGTVSSVGHPAYTKRGFVYSKNANPRLDATGLPESGVTMAEAQGTGVGTFSTTISGLTENATYYVCAYASIDNKNVAYGDQVSFVAEIVLPYIELTAAGIAVQKTDITHSNINWTSAESLCRNSIVGGYNDWRIPTINELATLFSNRGVIGGFQTTTQPTGGYTYTAAYWSDTSPSFNNYYLINFVNGSQITGYGSYDYSRSSSPYYYYYCRCVRDLTE